MIQRTQTRHIDTSSITTHVINDTAYTVIRFAEGKEPKSLAQLIQFVGSREGVEMLTISEARAIKDDPQPSFEFRHEKVLQPGEWSYVRDPESEARSRAAYFLCGMDYRRLIVGGNDGADDTSQVVVLKQTKPASIQQAQAGSVAASQKVEPALVDSFRSFVTKTEGILNEELHAVAIQLLRAIE